MKKKDRNKRKRREKHPSQKDAYRHKRRNHTLHPRLALCHIRCLYATGIQLILFYRRKRPKYPGTSRSRGIARNPERHTKLCRSTRSPTFAIPYKRLFRDFGIFYCGVPHCLRHEADESLPVHRMEMVRKLLHINGMAIRHSRLCLRRHVSRLFPLSRRIARI